MKRAMIFVPARLAMSIYAMTEPEIGKYMTTVSLAPTPKLRFVDRAGSKILQQYWDLDVPSYMRGGSHGEWRDVETTAETPAAKHVEKDHRSDAAEPAP
jgi:hypothetical protein